MDIKKYEQTISYPLKTATLTFLIKKDQILLAMKKRGFGVGKWNGVGGKLNENETVEQAALREAKEEINVTPENIKKVAVINFYFPLKNFGQQVHVYIAKTWQGEPQETEEMQPQWFKIKDIPYKEMWWDDEIWLPLVLKGNLIKASFVFNEKDEVADHGLKVVKNFN